MTKLKFQVRFVLQLFAACLVTQISLPSAVLADPIYTSTSDTVFDIIQEGDPSSFVCLNYVGRATRQMWDKRKDNEFDLEVFLFQAHFNDTPPFDIIVNPEFGTRENSEVEVRRYTDALGQLPLALRHGIRQFGIHKGTPTYSGGPEKIFVYADTTTRRINANHLEESLLHEAVHATLDNQFALSPEWRAAQTSDGAFLTRYAEQYPEREDLAETVLFAFGLIQYPGRIPPVDSADILRSIPARVSFVEQILMYSPPDFQPRDPPKNCS